MNADDVLIAMVIAIAVVLIAAYFKYRLRGSDVQGYWGTADGKQYAIRASSNGELSIVGPHLEARGRVRPLRSVCIGNGEATVCGTVEIDGRWLSWPGGVSWVRSGLNRP